MRAEEFGAPCSFSRKEKKFWTFPVILVVSVAGGAEGVAGVAVATGVLDFLTFSSAPSSTPVTAAREGVAV